MAVTIDGSADTITARANSAVTATTALNAIGVGQTWQLLTNLTTPPRVAATEYTNDTGRPIFISVRLARDDGIMELYIDGLMIGRTGETPGPAALTLTGIIPAGSRYQVNISGATLFWYELR